MTLSDPFETPGSTVKLIAALCDAAVSEILLTLQQGEHNLWLSTISVTWPRFGAATAPALFATLISPL